MANLNKVMMIGRLAREPESRANGKVTGFGFAVNNRRKNQAGQWEDEPCYVDVDCFGQTAEFVMAHLHKGDQVYVEGSLKLDQWTTSSGEKRQKLKVAAFSVLALGPRQEARDAPQSEPADSPF